MNVSRKRIRKLIKRILDANITDLKTELFIKALIEEFEYSPSRFHETQDSISEFMWDGTKEGFQFWERVSNYVDYTF